MGPRKAFSLKQAIRYAQLCGKATNEAVSVSKRRVSEYLFTKLRLVSSQEVASVLQLTEANQYEQEVLCREARTIVLTTPEAEQTVLARNSARISATVMK